MRYRSTLAIAIACLSGCSSGVPGFVKYTPDSRCIIFNDGGYVRSCVHHLPTGKTYVFEGSFACEAPDGRRWIIAPAPLASDRGLFLVGVHPDREPAITRLPPLPGIGVMSSITLAFGPGGDEISLCHRPDRTARDYFVFRLKMGEAKWRELQSEADREAVLQMTSNRPKDSIALLGYIPPSPFSYSNGRGERVRRVRETRDRSSYRYEDRLPSPDGKTFVTVHADLPSTGWALGSGQTTLTDVESGKTRTLISNTDLAWRLWQRCIWGPSVAVAMAAVAPRF